MKTNVAIIFSLIFLFILFLLSKFLEPKLISIEETKKKSYGEWVKIRGYVKLKKTYNFTLVKVCDNTDCIFAFSKTPITNFNLDDYVEIIGKINKYKEKLISIEEVRILKLKNG